MAVLLFLLPLLALALMFQRNLLFPSPKRNAVMSANQHSILPVALPVPGGTVQGYYARAHRKARHGLVYFNGRREHPTSIFRALDALPDCDVFCFYYPGLGFGLNKPDEAEMLAIGESVFTGFSALSGLSPERIAIAGRSLGSGLAVGVAVLVKPMRLILISPFDRLISAVQQAVPLMHEAWLKDAYDTAARVSAVDCPSLLVVGEADRMIPASLSRRLFDGWEGQLSVLALANEGHCGLLKRPDVHHAIAEFIGSSQQD